MSKIDSLKFIRIYDFNLVPRRFFEYIQKKDESQDVDKLYQWSANVLQNPLHLFYVAINQDNVIHGILWTIIDPVNEELWLNGISFDKEYRGNGKGDNIILRCVAFLREQVLTKDENKQIKIKTTVLRPKTFERLGWKKSDRTIMEI